MTIQTFTPTAVVDLPAMPAEMAAIVQWANTASAAQSLVELIVDTPFMPAAFWPKFDPRDHAERDRARGIAVASGTAAVLYGGPLGLNPLQALANIHVVKGKPGLYAELMVALVRAAGHEVHVEDSTDTRVRVWGRRRGEDSVYRSEFTFDRAKKAGYVAQNQKYTSDPQAMLYARAVSILCRQMAPEVLKGLSVVEELHDEVDPDAPPSRGTRTVQRGAPARALPASSPAGAAPSVRPPTPGQPVYEAQGAPPLPGEETTDQDGDAPGVTDAQLRALGAAFSELGVKGAGERADRLAVTSELVGRPIGSAKELSRDDASLVLDNLRASGPSIVADILGRGSAVDDPKPAAGGPLAVPGDVVDQGDEPPQLPADPNGYDPTVEAGFGEDGDPR